MWYSRNITSKLKDLASMVAYKPTVTAGAENVLQGGIELKSGGNSLENALNTIMSFRYAYKIDQLPSYEATMKFLTSDYKVFIAQAKQEGEEKNHENYADIYSSEIYKQLESFALHIISLYLKEPKMAPYADAIYARLGAIAKHHMAIDPKVTVYSYELSDVDSGKSYWLAETLNHGYGNILNLEKAGLHMHPSFKMMIMMGLDVKAKPELAEQPGRKQMIQYIAQKYPFYARFVINDGDDSSVRQTLVSLCNKDPSIQEELSASLLPGEKTFSSYAAQQDPVVHNTDKINKALLGSGLPTHDLTTYMAFVASQGISNEVTTNFLNTSINRCASVEELTPVLLNEVENHADKNLYKELVLNYLNKIYASQPGYSINKSTLNALMQSPRMSAQIKNIWTEVAADQKSTMHERLVKMGIAPAKSIMQWLLQYPRSKDSFLFLDPQLDAKATMRLEKERKRQEKEQANNLQTEDTEEEIQSEELGAVKPEPKKRVPAPKGTLSPMAKIIQEGSIEHASLAEFQGGKYMQVAHRIGAAMALKPEIVDRWGDLIQVYWLLNPALAQYLQEEKSNSYDTLRDFKFLGMFTNYFSRDEDPNTRMPSIFLNRYATQQQFSSSLILKNIGMPPEAADYAVMCHEIAHALNYLSNGGKFPKVQNGTGNQARDYVESLPEIIARVYGEIPAWRELLTKRIDELRMTDLIQKAVQEEITESSIFLMVRAACTDLIDPENEFVRAKEMQKPYDRAANPLEAATKRIERNKARAFRMLQTLKSKSRPLILRSILRQIRSVQMEISALTEENRTQDPEQEQRLKTDLIRVRKMFTDAYEGKYDWPIDTTIESVTSNFMARALKDVSESVSDPSWVPPFTLVTKDNEEIRPETPKEKRPMTYEQVRLMSDADYKWSGQGPMEAPKDDFQTSGVLPYIFGYEDKFNKEIEPLYNERRQKIPPIKSRTPQ